MKHRITKRDFRRGFINEEHQKKISYATKKRDIVAKGRRKVENMRDR